MSLINYDQIPAAIDNGVYAFLVVLFNALISPSSMTLYGFDGVHRRDNLIVLTIDIFVVRYTANGIIIGWQYHIELLMELIMHFCCPLSDESGRANNKNTLNKPTSF